MVFKIILGILIILSIAAGIPKIIQMPQELEFLSNIGLGKYAVTVFGVVQTLGGILLLFPHVRLIGAALAIVAFLVSSVAIFAGGGSVFGFVSTLPVILALYVLVVVKRGTQNP